MSRGLGRLQRRILEALEPSQQLYCGRYRHEGACVPDLCYGWVWDPHMGGYGQLPPWVYDLRRVRRYLEQQEASTRPQLPPLPRRHSMEERAAWAIARFGMPNARAFAADVARALKTLLTRGQLVRCDTFPLVRFQRSPVYTRSHSWVLAWSEEEATLSYPSERRVRFVTTPEADKR